MSGTSRPWRGAGLLLLGGALLTGARVFGADEPPMSNQLADLGQQALAQGATRAAEKFFKGSLELDPANQAATDGLKEVKRADEVLLVAMQEPKKDEKPAAPADDAPPQAPKDDAKATLERTQAAENITRQELTDNVEQRLKTAQALMSQNQPEASMNALRLALNVIRSATDVSDDVRKKLETRVQAQLMSVAQAEDRIVNERAERTRLDSAAEQRTRTIDILQRDKQTIEAMMIQFDLLIREGVYNVLYSGGMGNIVTTSAPFGEARLLAQQAYALQRGGPLPYSDNDPSPGAGYFVSYTMGFYTQEIQFRMLTKYRFLLTMQDITRASVPFPDTQTIEYPDAAWWRYISEKRIRKYGKAVDLFERDLQWHSNLCRPDRAFGS
jgi:hypothetical protein